METLHLSKNHQRILGSLLFVLEQKAEQIEHIIEHKNENASYIVEQDLEENTLTEILSNCRALKEKLSEVAEKFNIPKRKINLYHYIGTIQSQMWEHVIDAFSDKLRGYGEKLKTEAKQVDPDIQELAEIIDRLKV